MKKTNTKIQADYKARQKAMGKKRLEIWARPEHHQEIKDYAEKLNKGK